MMREKWTVAFKLLDFNKDGLISDTDREMCKKSFVEAYHPTAYHHAKMLSELDHFWSKSLFLFGREDWDEPFTLDRLLDSREAAFSIDPEATKQKVHEAMIHLLQAADLNNKGSFTFDEFKQLHYAFNIKDEGLVHVLFGVIGGESAEKCTVDDVAGFYTELTMGSDVDKHGLYKAALAAAGFL